MYITKKISGNDIASVYQAENEAGNSFEFVESTQPPYSYDHKIIVIVSALYGCPVNCGMCAAGEKFKGILSREDLLFQIDHIVESKYNNRKVTADVFEIRFARKGDPSYNMNIIKVLKDIPGRYSYKYLIPSLATIAPTDREEFFESLMAMKKLYFADNFKLRFSIHSTDERQRDMLLPVKKMGLRQIADYGSKFFDHNGSKITLFFAVNNQSIISVDRLSAIFDPEIFRIHFSPASPGIFNFSKDVEAIVSHASNQPKLATALLDAGFELSASLSEWEEKGLGINCRQFISQQTAELKDQNAGMDYGRKIIFNQKHA